ncbi:hypothetical protein [uncultured Thiocystis sp.]|jgi:hypothetical protein|uniref:hypothetical protein n=1 Tax=uncultured Thiocystis sp. TaxID=1202134 RepID=UPI0025E526E9|nr:hypothetical protein [uncultured Thiocystis sp.]
MPSVKNWVLPTLTAVVLLLGSTALPAVECVATPSPGSVERKAILDALREHSEDAVSREIVFVVGALKVCSGWAWLHALPQSPDGRDRFEDISALLRKTHGRWHVVEIPCSEPDNPECLGEPGYFARLKQRFPALPDAILSE